MPASSKTTETSKPASKRAPKRAPKKPSGKAPRRKKSSARSLNLRAIVAAIGGVTALGLTLAALWLGMVYLAVAVEVKDRMAGQRWDLPSKLYAQPLLLQAGSPAPAGDFADLLIAMGYQKRDRVQRAGEFRSAGSGRYYVFPYDPPRPGPNTVQARLDIQLSGNKVTGLSNYDAKKRLGKVEVPGLPFAELHQGEHEARRVTKLQGFSKALRDAVVAIEDERFYSHGALDPIGIARAMFVNLTAGQMRQGGSTLTQQAAKNFFLTQERTLSRKLKEVLYSVALERNYSKDAILELYLNEIYLGQDGSTSICGMGEAAYHYFSRKPAELSLSEAALLAGMIQAPNGLNPQRHSEKAQQRRNVVLNKMAELGYVSAEEAKAAAAEPLTLRPGRYAKKDAPWFVDEVLEELSSIADAQTLSSAGFAVRTTLDWRVQRAAERALEKGLGRLKGAGLQGAIVVLDPQTGHILALVGGRDYAESQFNRALNAHRQPGSAFKPFVYAAAFRTLGHGFGPTFALKDEPVTLKADKGNWTPSNFNEGYSGVVTAREALERSLNLAVVDLSQQVGVEAIVSTARAAGITSACASSGSAEDGAREERDCSRNNPAWLHPSLALGSKEVTPLELARAYTAIASDGRVRPTLAVLEVLNPAGERVFASSAHPEATVLPADAAWLVRDMMAGVIDDGTARAVRAHGYTYRASGKTGTTNDERDAWFVGFDAELLTVVWVGFDNNRPTGYTGGQAAAPIWAELMTEVRKGRPPPEDPTPATIAVHSICRATGALAARACPEPIEEVFFADSPPTHVCPEHGGVPEQVRENVRSWLDRVFGGGRVRFSPPVQNFETN